MTRSLPVFFAVAALAAADDGPATPTIRGKWEVTAATFNGTTFADPRGRVLEFGDEEVTTHAGDLPIRSVAYTVEAKADPRRIDLDAGDETRKALGIYTVDKDELRICYAEPGAERPARFESKPGGRAFLLVLKRVRE